ncbi:MAG: acyl-CoA dehydrogenase family protein [Candidatus Nanopelagicales bacterium]
MIEFTSEHRQFRASVRRFVETEINPNADKWEADAFFPAHELFPKAGELGLFGLEVDPEFGGQGADHTYTLILGEELGRADVAGVPLAIAVQASMSTPSLAKYGSAELKTKYLAPALSGQMVSAVAVSEPDAGSDVAGIRTKAVRDGDDWVITGRKMWITNGTQADWLCLLARTVEPGDEPATGYRGMSQIIVPTDSPGFSVGRKIEKMGNHSSDTAELVLDEVRVPVANTVGRVGKGFQQQMGQFQDERLMGAYMATSGARRAIERTGEYLKVRHAFGEPLINNQYLRFRLAELAAEVDLLTQYNYSAAERFTAGQDVTKMATIAKWKTGKLAREVADVAVQFHGGMGYAEEMWPARYLRDSRLISIGGGADEVMLRVIAMMEGWERL